MSFYTLHPSKSKHTHKEMPCMSFLYANPYHNISRRALLSPSSCRDLMMTYFNKCEDVQYLLCCFVLYYEHGVVGGLHEFVSYFFAANNPLIDESDALDICKMLEEHDILEVYGEAGVYMLAQKRYEEAAKCFVKARSDPYAIYAISCMLENVDGFEEFHDIQKCLNVKADCSYQKRAFEMKSMIQQRGIHIPTLLTLAVQHETGIVDVLKPNLKKAYCLYEQAYTRGHSFIACICLMNLECGMNDKMLQEENRVYAGDAKIEENLARIMSALAKFKTIVDFRNREDVPCELPTILSPHAQTHLEINHLRTFLMFLNRYEENLKSMRIKAASSSSFDVMEECVCTLRHCVVVNVRNCIIHLPCDESNRVKVENFKTWRDNGMKKDKLAAWRNNLKTSDECAICFHRIDYHQKVRGANCRHHICVKCDKICEENFQTQAEESRVCCLCRSPWH